MDIVFGSHVEYDKYLFCPECECEPVLVVEEAGVPGENHRPWASNWLTLSLAATSRVQPFW